MKVLGLKHSEVCTDVEDKCTEVLVDWFEYPRDTGVAGFAVWDGQLGVPTPLNSRHQSEPRLAEQSATDARVLAKCQAENKQLKQDLRKKRAREGAAEVGGRRPSRGLRTAT